MRYNQSSLSPVQLLMSTMPGLFLSRYPLPWLDPICSFTGFWENPGHNQELSYRSLQRNTHGSRGRRTLSKVSGHTRVSFCQTIPQGLGGFVIQHFHRHWLSCFLKMDTKIFSLSAHFLYCKLTPLHQHKLPPLYPFFPCHKPFKVTTNHPFFLPKQPVFLRWGRERPSVASIPLTALSVVQFSGTFLLIFKSLLESEK